MTDDNGDWEELTPGRLVKRGPGGQIEATRLAPEVAQEMSRASQRRKGKDFADRVDKILVAYGFGPDNPAPEFAYELAGLVAEGKAGAVSAHRALSDLSPIKVGPGEKIELKPGDLCPTCRQYVGELDGDVLLLLLGILESDQAQPALKELWESKQSRR